MITVDPRQGSGHLAKRLSKRGLATRLEHLEFGDIAFQGLGPDDQPLLIGVEIKEFQEFCGDLLVSRFTGHQLPGMCQLYDRRYLVIEGAYKVDYKSGRLTVPRGASYSPVRIGRTYPTYHQLLGRLLSISHQAGFTVQFVHSEWQLVSFLVALYTWWDKGWDNHHSLETFYEPTPELALKAPTRFRKALHALCEGLGWQRTEAVEKLWSSMAALLHADIKELEQVKGIGPKLALSIYQSLRK